MDLVDVDVVGLQALELEIDGRIRCLRPVPTSFWLSLMRIPTLVDSTMSSRFVIFMSVAPMISSERPAL